MLDNLPVGSTQDRLFYPQSSPTSSTGTDLAKISALCHPGASSALEYLAKQELLSTPIRKRFFPRASPSILMALLETPPTERIYSPEPSDEPCTSLGQLVDCKNRVLETSFLAKQHGLDDTQSSRAPAPASLPNATPLPLRLSLLPSLSATPDLDSFTLSLPTSDAGSSPATHTQSAHAPHSHSKHSDPFVASRRSSHSHGPPRPQALPRRFPECLFPTVTAAPCSPQASAAVTTRAAEREGSPSPSSVCMRLSRTSDPRRVMEHSGLTVGMVEGLQRVMCQERQGLGDEHHRSASARSDDGDVVVVGVEPPSPSPKPGRGHCHWDADAELNPLAMARGSTFSGSVSHHSQLAVSVSDADIAELQLAHGGDSFRLAATASAPLLCSLGPGLESDDGRGAHTHTHAEDTQRMPGGFPFWQPRFSLHVAGGDFSSSSGSAGGSGVRASDSSHLPPSSTFEAMRRDFIALLSDQADEEEAQAEQLRAIANRLEKRAWSKRHLVDAIA
ncbi:hypothetical protein LXA43DRAFT_1093182 [Ganoderma leucocontextum]|nr:hypothetical protein LXA43DRAFT_1093182 [Ganoderma leucocontextum]